MGIPSDFRLEVGRFDPRITENPSEQTWPDLLAVMARNDGATAVLVGEHHVAPMLSNLLETKGA